MNVEYCGNNVLEINMLGQFTISYGDKSISDKELGSKQLCALLQYLLLFRFTDISQETLIEILWTNKEIKDPRNALKNLVYRLRRVLKSVEGDREYILYSNEKYFWDNSIPCRIDIEEVEKKYSYCTDKDLPQSEKKELLQAIVEMYKGGIAPSASLDGWITHLSTYYKRIYVNSVSMLSDIYIQNEQYNDAILICERAVAIDYFEDSLHESLIKAYMASGRYDQAASYYEKIKNYFYKELGTEPSEKIKKLYGQILNGNKKNETEFEFIRNDLSENKNSQGAFFCEYQVFKSLYSFKARSMKRLARNTFVCLITLSGLKKKPLSVKKQDKAMEALRDVIIHSIRREDVVARYSVTQYVILLDTRTKDNAKLVLDRIANKFYKEYKEDSILLSSRVALVEPSEKNKKDAFCDHFVTDLDIMNVK
jgi:DNA-binding SARP family transcriptional activator